MNNYGVALFYNTSSAIRSEKVLAKAGVNFKMIPTPRELSSDCSVAIRFDWARVKSVKTSLDAAGVEIAGIHRI